MNIITDAELITKDFFNIAGQNALYNDVEILFLYEEEYEDMTISVQVSQVASPSVGDIVVIDGVAYKVYNFEHTDYTKTQWLLAIEKV